MKNKMKSIEFIEMKGIRKIFDRKIACSKGYFGEKEKVKENVHTVYLAFKRLVDFVVSMLIIMVAIIVITIIILLAMSGNSLS